MTSSKAITNRISIMTQSALYSKHSKLLRLLTSLFLMAFGGVGGSATPTSTSTSISATAIEVPNGGITSFSSTVTPGDRTAFTVTPNDNFQIDSVTGYSGTLVGNTLTKGRLTTDRTVTTSFTIIIPVTVPTTDAAKPTLSHVQTKLFQLT
jgi:hypothetical protein